MWLDAAHLVGVALWGGGLLAVTALRRRPGPAASTVYRWIAAPGAYLAILTGVWLLHTDQPLLRSGHLHAKAAGLVVLGLLDHLAGRPPAPDAGRRPLLLQAAVASTLAFVALTALLRPEAA